MRVTISSGVREDIRRFISARGEGSPIILLGNTSQALDLAAHVMADVEGVTLVSGMEHHSNDLPHRRRGDVVHFGLLADGSLDYEELEQRLRAHRVKLVAVTGASNVTGHLPDVHRIARLAHAHGARILVDAAQRLAHAPIDVRPEGDPDHIDFLAAAGHKAYAPFGASFLYAPRDLCDRAQPYVRFLHRRRCAARARGDTPRPRERHRRAQWIRSLPGRARASASPIAT